MSVITPWAVNYAAQECHWQQSGEMSVAWMVEGWRRAHRLRFQLIKLRDVLELGRLVEPRYNFNGLREVDVRVGSDTKTPWEHVPGDLDELLLSQPAAGKATEEEATEWFRQYEEIHPWRDGNGRTGSILYNWLRGSLPEPIYPPNLWDDPRRVYPEYPRPIL